MTMRWKTQVGTFMIEKSGANRGSIITGSSVHNSTVERTHRDVFCGVLVFLARIFQDMEAMGTLDPLNDNHLFCLHHVFIPRINRSLEEFVLQMNNGPVSTEHNMSPIQKWEEGMLQNRHLDYTNLTEEELMGYGTDPENILPVDDSLMFHLFRLMFLIMFLINYQILSLKMEVMVRQSLKHVCNS